MFMKPALWDDCYEAKTATLENMYAQARARHSNGMDAEKDVQRWARTDTRFHNAIKSGHDLGDATRRFIQGDRAALSFLKGPKD
jgi:hypothetical protein